MCFPAAQQRPLQHKRCEFKLSKHERDYVLAHFQRKMTVSSEHFICTIQTFKNCTYSTTADRFTVPVPAHTNHVSKNYVLLHSPHS